MRITMKSKTKKLQNFYITFFILLVTLAKLNNFITCILHNDEIVVDKGNNNKKVVDSANPTTTTTITDSNTLFTPTYINNLEENSNGIQAESSHSFVVNQDSQKPTSTSTSNNKKNNNDQIINSIETQTNNQFEKKLEIKESENKVSTNNPVESTTPDSGSNLKLENEIETLEVKKKEENIEQTITTTATAKSPLTITSTDKKPINLVNVAVNKADMQSFEEWKEMKLKDALREHGSGFISSQQQQNDENNNEQTISTSSLQSSSASQSSQKVAAKDDNSNLNNNNNNNKVLIVPRRKNYASLDCGAKLIAHNPESSNPSHILTESKDDYMLNSCSSQAWFVIELCESIKINEIELANFELFSNVPRLFRVYTSERYIQTTNGNNVWPSKYLLGTFEASNTRSIQKFSIKDAIKTKEETTTMAPVFDVISNTTNNSEPINSTNLNNNNNQPSLIMYAKYVKFEMLSHYGNEHYCPLSLVRIYGTNLVDDDDELNDHHEHQLNILNNQIIHQQQQEKTKTETSTQSQSIKNLSNDSKPISSESFIMIDNEKYNDSMKRLLKLNFFNNLISIFYHKNSIDLNLTINSTFSLKKLIENDFYQFFCSLNHYYSSNYNHLNKTRRMSKICPNFLRESLSYYLTVISTIQSQNAGSLYNKYLNNIKIVVDSDEIKNYSEINILNSKFYISNDWLQFHANLSRFLNSSNHNKVQNDSTLNEEQTNEMSINQTLNTNNEKKEEDNILTVATKLEASKPAPINQEKLVKLEEIIQTKDSIFELSQSTTSTSNKHDSEPTVTSETVFPTSSSDILTTLSTITSATTVSFSFVSPDISATTTLQTTTVGSTSTSAPSQSTPSPAQATVSPTIVISNKDAMFLRLSNRIKILELNMSLSSQYLEKLSQHYKRQMDDMQTAFNITTTALLDTIRVADERDMKQNERITNVEKRLEKMQSHLDTLNKYLNDIKFQTDIIMWTIIIVMNFFIIIELIRCVKFSSINSNKKRLNEASNQQINHQKNGCNGKRLFDENNEIVKQIESIVEKKLKQLLEEEIRSNLVIDLLKSKQEQEDENNKNEMTKPVNFEKLGPLLTNQLQNNISSNNNGNETSSGQQQQHQQQQQQQVAAAVVSSTLAVVAAVSLAAAATASCSTLNQQNDEIDSYVE